METLQKNHKSIHWINTIRGIATAGVLLTHFLPQLMMRFQRESAFVDWITVSYIDVGKIGVALFFLLAGFLTPTSVARRSSFQFVINRFFRLYPLYWLSILLVGLIFRFDNYGLITIISNFSMLQVFFGQEDLVGLFWTLPIELMVYAAGVVLKKYMWEGKYLLILELLAALFAIGLAIMRKYVWATAPVAIGLLFMVAIVGQVFRICYEHQEKGKYLPISVAVFECTLLATSLLAYQVDVGHNENWYRYFNSYSMAVVLFLTFMYSQKNIGIFNRLAVISYPVYLLQEPLFRILFEQEAIFSPNSTLGTGISIVGFTLFSLMILIIVSYVAHEAVEIPFAKLGNRIEARCNSNRA